MTNRRSYNDACAASHGLDLVGERWALLVVRELLLGPKRFTDLRAGLPGISANVLTQRLTELEEAAVVRRRKLPPPASAWIYELTEWGQELEPVVMALGRWAARSPNLFRGVPIGVDSFILSLQTMFAPQKAEGVHARVELRFGEDRFTLDVEDGTLRVERRAAMRPDVVLTGDPNTMAALTYAGIPLEALVEQGALKVEGDRSVLAKLLTLFPLPEPAPAAPSSAG